MRALFERLGRAARRCPTSTVRMLAVALATSTVTTAAVAQPAKVVVPFGCAVESGRLAVHPAGERAHPIIGARSSHPFTTCAAGKEPRCRTFMVHKFDLSCDGFRVSWLGLVGGALERDDPRIRIVANRFTLRMPPGWNAGRGGLGAATGPDVVTFPAGFAPALNFPIRFTGNVEPAPTVATWNKTWDKPRAEERQIVRVAATMPVVAAPPAAIATSSTTVDASSPATDASSWLTTVEPVTRAFGDTTRERLAALAAAVALAWLVLFAVRRRLKGAPANAFVAGRKALAAPAADTTEKSPDTTQSPPHPEPATDTGPGATASEGDTYAAHCARMIADAVTLHKATREALPSISNGSLRGVLQDDLDKVQAVLLAPGLANDIACGLWSSVEIAVTRVLADLDRVGRIIEGLSKAGISDVIRHATAVPETADDAFHLLGVRPDASPVAVKKIVDGLRLSWHPDHARDDTDRSIREARLKQINVAWDLIQDQQKAA